MSRQKQLTYSQASRELQQIISEIESENVDLDVLAEKVKRATYLIKFCKSRLRDTEEEVKKVLTEIEDKAEETGAGDGASDKNQQDIT
ncbi:MAG: exodeoxyribonuclease VII small subunit [Nitrospirae bacterium]|nr:exodeoxyribonuclease VII small subunit [Nitrospirota bacterium]